MPQRDRFDVEPFALDRHRLPQWQARGQFTHRGLARPDHVRWRRLEEPRRERLLAAARARRREQLKQAAVSEEVEIGGVEVVVGSETIALIAVANPLVADAAYPLFVPRDRPPRPGSG